MGGWITPTTPVEHEDASKRGGKIFLHVNDVDLATEKRLRKGMKVEFLLYADEDGLGACQCKLSADQPDLPPEKPLPAGKLKEGTQERTPGKGFVKGTWVWQSFDDSRGSFRGKGKGKGKEKNRVKGKGKGRAKGKKEKEAGDDEEDEEQEEQEEQEEIEEMEEPGEEEDEEEDQQRSKRSFKGSGSFRGKGAA